MGKGKRLKQLRRTKYSDMEKQFAELMTKNFQKELKSSEIWDQIVEEFGETSAEEMLKECKAEIKHDI